VTSTEKPAYRVPTMDEVRAVPWNGRVVASTFSGAGGSCLGYRMAGYRVGWANEFTEQSGRIYRLNHSTHLDQRDIREVKPEEVLEVLELDRGELDVLDGSPPCDSFSSIGSREKGWGKQKDYAKGIKQRTDDLFFEYARLLEGLQPKAFVAENVKGMVEGKARGYFLEILRALKKCGYLVKARVLDAQWLGVPQHRERVIFVGVREDLEVEPRFPSPLGYRVSTREALSGVPVRGQIVGAKGDGSWDRRWGSADQPHPTICAGGSMRSGQIEVLRKQVVGNEAFEPTWGSLDGPAPTICAAGARTAGRVEVARDGVVARRAMTIPELKRICSFPDDFAMEGAEADRWRALGMSVPPIMMRAVALELAGVLEEADPGGSR